LLEDLPTSDAKLAKVETPTARRATKASPPQMLDHLASWRSRHAAKLFLMPEEVCSVEDLQLVVERKPQTEEDLASIFGPVTSMKISSEILPIVKLFS
jgi:ribonuclease D